MTSVRSTFSFWVKESSYFGRPKPMFWDPRGGETLGACVARSFAPAAWLTTDSDDEDWNQTGSIVLCGMDCDPFLPISEGAAIHGPGTLTG